MKMLNLYLRSNRNIIIYPLLLLTFMTNNALSQNFNLVSCKATNETKAFGIYNNELIFCYGGFKICGITINGFGLWNNNNWKAFPQGVDVNSGGLPLNFVTYKNQLYAGGNFYTIGGKTTNKIARWNGQQWDSVGSGLDDQNVSERIEAMAVYKNELYVAGLIRQVNGVSGYNHIAVWNGTTWRRIAGVSGSLPKIYCMAVYKNELYVGGLFYQAGTTPASFIARWNGQQWKSVGLGADYIVHTMVVDTVRDLLYIGGAFFNVGNNIPTRIAQWDGTNWKSLGNTDFFQSSILDLEMYHGYLYAAGVSMNGLTTDTCMARWDGEKWEAILGPNSTITSLQTYKDELYLGGSFTKIGNDSISYLARYYSADSVFIGTDNKPKLIKELVVYPNPVENTLHIKSNLEFKSFIIYNAQGKKVQTLNNPSLKAIQTSDLSNGVYLLKAISKSGEEYNARFVVEKE